MGQQSELIGIWKKVRATLDSSSKKPSDCLTFQDLFDKWTSAGNNAQIASDNCKSRLSDLFDAEEELTLAQSGYGAALAAAAAIGLGPGAIAAQAAVTVAAGVVAASLAKRDKAKSQYDNAVDMQTKALSMEREAKDTVVSHRSSCPQCLKA